MNRTLIIAFGHKARRGKDTAVAHLIATFKDRYDIRRYAFADELKREFSAEVDRIMAAQGVPAPIAIVQLEQWAGVDHDDNMDMNDPLCPYGKPRPLLQWWGTEYRREGRVPGTPIPSPDPFYWIRMLRDRIRADKPQIALISDMRFINEAAMVKSESTDNVTVRLDRLGFEIAGGATAHKSETEMDTYGYDFEIIVADSPEGLQELKKDVVFVLDAVIEKLSAKYAVVGDEVFSAPLPPAEDDEMAVLLPTQTKPAKYKISTPEGVADASPEEFASFLRQ